MSLVTRGDSQLQVLAKPPATEWPHLKYPVALTPSAVSRISAFSRNSRGVRPAPRHSLTRPLPISPPPPRLPSLSLRQAWPLELQF